MSGLMEFLRFAVATTIVLILIGGAALEVQDKVAGQARAIPDGLARTVFDRDFDFGEILPAGYCPGVSPNNVAQLSASG